MKCGFLGGHCKIPVSVIPAFAGVTFAFHCMNFATTSSVMGQGYREMGNNGRGKKSD